MRVLVTNDDGVHAPGIVALALAMREAMFDVVMVAPRGEMSGSSASMAAPNDEIRYERVCVEGWPDDAYALLHLAKALLGSGRPDEARMMLHRVLELGQACAYFEQAREMVDALA